jgi:hypothetical protein
MTTFTSKYNPQFFWPANIYYGKDDNDKETGSQYISKYSCSSFLDGKNEFHQVVIRVKDQAYQVLKGISRAQGQPLYADPECTRMTDIVISRTDWTVLAARRESHDRNPVFNSISVVESDELLIDHNPDFEETNQR